FASLAGFFRAPMAPLREVTKDEYAPDLYGQDSDSNAYGDRQGDRGLETQAAIGEHPAEPDRVSPVSVLRPSRVGDRRPADLRPADLRATPAYLYPTGDLEAMAAAPGPPLVGRRDPFRHSGLAARTRHGGCPAPRPPGMQPAQRHARQ